MCLAQLFLSKKLCTTTSSNLFSSPVKIKSLCALDHPLNVDRACSLLRPIRTNTGSRYTMLGLREARNAMTGPCGSVNFDGPSQVELDCVIVVIMGIDLCALSNATAVLSLLAEPSELGRNRGVSTLDDCERAISHK